jgi:hypothetical protein
MTITMDALAAAFASTPRLEFSKVGVATEGVGTWTDMWKNTGSPAAGANGPVFSGAGPFVCAYGTVGYLPGFGTNGTAQAGNDLYLSNFSVQAGAVGTLVLCDRLWHCSGFSGTATAAQSVGTPSDIPARDDNAAALGAGVEPWIVFNTAPGATAATMTLTGTDETGATTRTWTYAHPANAETAQQIVPAMPGGGSPGALGMRRLVSFTNSISTGTVGDIGVVLLRRIASIPVATANIGNALDFAGTRLEKIHDLSCLFALWLNGAASPMPQIMGSVKILELTP